jgi:chromosome partitioning protein
VPNRVDRRTLEGKQLIDELIAFGERVSPPIGNRTAFIRAFSTGFPIAGWAGELAYGEIRALTDLVESFLRPAPADAG